MDGPKAVQIIYAQCRIAKLITTASDSVPPEMLRRLMLTEPAASELANTLYDPAVAWPPEIVRTTVSFAEMKLLFSVNVALVAVVKDALFMVMRPAGLFSVTAVDLSVACVTVPCAAAV